METQTLRLENGSGTVENNYNLSIDVPSKLEILELIERPPFYISSKTETTFSTGVLAHVPHSFKLRISRDYQEPYVGMFVKVTHKEDELLEVLDIKGTFEFQTTKNEKNSQHPSRNNSSSSTHSQNANLHNHYRNESSLQNSQNSHPSQNNSYMSSSHNQNYNQQNGNMYVNNNNNEDSQAQQKKVNFSFFKTSVLRFPDMDHYDYYESKCQWPDVTTRLRISMRVLRRTYAVFVNEDYSIPQVQPFTNCLNSEPYYMSENFSDIRIIVGSTSIPAHKMILSARSKYFEGMFSSNMRETKEGVVKIDDVDENLVKEMMRFIYLGTVENIAANAADLLLLADKYVIEDLGNYCEKYLVDHISIDNAAEMYDLSRTVGTQRALAKKSKQLIMWNKGKFIADLDTFKTFMTKYPEFVLELMKL